MHIESPRTQAYQSDLMLRALRAVLRDENASFRSPQQEAAVRAAELKKAPSSNSADGRWKKPTLYGSGNAVWLWCNYRGSAICGA